MPALAPLAIQSIGVRAGRRSARLRQERESIVIKVSAEPERKRVRAIMGGLLTVADVERFSAEEQAAVREMGLGSGEFDLLVETLSNVVQTLEVMEAFAKLLGDSPLKARKIATVRHGALTRMQSRRLAHVRSNYEVFGSVEEAEAWLREP